MSTFALLLALAGTPAGLLAQAANTAPAQGSDQTAPAAKPVEQTVTLDTYVVNSVRASLITAQDIKSNTPQFVDSIVAQDVGKLPDNTVADALQRIAGIQVARAAGEANTPVIRGLPAIESTIDGYEVFTGTGRGVAFQDIPAEMVAGLDAYKSVNPDQLDGGVAGLIDVRLRHPLDFKEGVTTALNVRGMYSTQARKDSYFVSGLVSDHVQTADGDFGLLLDISYQRRRYEDQIFDNWVHYPAGFDVAYDSSGKGGYYGDNFGYQVIPGDRKRPAANLILQWKNKTGLELYSETLYTGYRNVHQVDFFIGIPSWGGSRSNVVLYPSGYDGVHIPDPLNLNGTGQDALFVKSLTATDTNTLSSMQSFDDRTDTVQGAFGAKWNRDNMQLDAEISYNVSTVKTRGEILDTGTNSPSEVLNITYNDGSNPTVTSTGLDFANGNNFFVNQLFDQWSRAYSGQFAAKADAKFSIANSFLKSVQVGLRYSDRLVNYHQDDPSPHGIPFFATPASTIPGLGGIFTNQLFVPSDQMSIRSWWSPSPSFLLNNTDTIRAIVGLPLGQQPADPSSTLKDTEKIFAVYAMANYSFGGNSKDRPLVDGVAGVRFVDSHESLAGYEHPVDSSGNSDFSRFVPDSNTNNQSKALPTLNGRIHLDDQLQLRFSATQTLTRPNFGDLNPALALFHSGPTSEVGTGTGGNPNLNPVRSTNYDLGLEFYASKTSQATITGFYRDLTGYVQSYAKLEDVGGTQYLITRPQNTGKGTLKGVEVTYQQFFDFLPAEFKGLGFQTNYTHIDGTTEDPSTGQQLQITQVAKNNYNVILIYETGPFSSRLAYTWRGQYIDSYNQPGFQPTTVYVQPTKQLDFSASYDLTKSITLTFDATNILGSKYRDRFGPTAMFNRDVRNYDTTYAIGARFRF
ncbi:MAG TPA: TonB-dependent receptor [Candidatus Didemnitutus sp.]|nr:TonB-dependent receptor [Candidatus Didemnitutus sp.]